MFNPTQMRAVAEKVYPDCGFHISGSQVYFDEIATDAVVIVSRKPFNPSLTGSADQQALALQCILAAFNLPWFLCAEIYGDDFVISIKDHGCIRTSHGPDLLTASIAALLASTDKEQS